MLSLPHAGQETGAAPHADANCKGRDWGPSLPDLEAPASESLRAQPVVFPVLISSGKLRQKRCQCKFLPLQTTIKGETRLPVQPDEFVIRRNFSLAFQRKIVFISAQ